jgi:AraC-like DNA-binding protein
MSENTLAFAQRSQAMVGLWSAGDAVSRSTCLWACLKTSPSADEYVERLLVSSVVIRIAARVVSRQRWRDCDDVSRQSSAPRRRAEGAIDFILCNYRSQQLTLEVAADRLHVSKYHLSHILSQQTGYSFPTHVSGLRCLAAALLLRSSDILVKEVAYLVGHSSTAEMDRQFRHWYRMTPSQFRSARWSDGKGTLKKDPLENHSGLTLQSIVEASDTLGVDLGAVLASAERQGSQGNDGRFWFRSLLTGSVLQEFWDQAFALLVIARLCRIHEA